MVESVWLRGTRRPLFFFFYANCDFEQVRELASWCFKTSRPQRIISGLKEIFIKRYIVEKTSKAELRPEDLSEKVESCRENSWNVIQLKGS